SLQNGQFSFETIGDQPPQGLTGSGLLQVVAELVRAGVVERNGRLAAEPPVLAGLLERKQAARSLYLTPTRDIWLTQKDIRELQKAKGAIRAAIQVLMQRLGLQANDLQRIILTGSFGGQLDVAAVTELGMIPAVPAERIHNIPNGAGLGAAMFLLDEGFTLAEALAQRTEQVDLDQNADFHRIFVEALAFQPGS
ncbi:MAG: DUF4445 domain-containing protein, partial [Anaerolineales bacterium]|nr:DUF4445 domain-containing protein [Anaerolineales bacterium]